MSLRTVFIIYISLLTFSVQAGAATENKINLEINYKTVHFKGKTKRAIAVNNQIPGPTLHLKEGEPVCITVHNCLEEGTTIHWHGVLVPWQMDGVNQVSQKAIPPGESFEYRFTPYQSGTYWYHSHTEAQEQEGLYGALVIEPRKAPDYKYTQDFSIVLSDFTWIKAEQVFLNLKKSGDYYAPRFPLQASLQKFLLEYECSNCEDKKELFKEYRSMQESRMSLYDLSDVAYDAYLLEGRTACCPWKALVNVGDVVRLRFVGAMGSTLYRIKIPDERMKVVHIQGNDVEPYSVSDFTLSPGETVDVLVNISQNKPYIIYAESNDTLGKVYGALLTDPSQTVENTVICSFPEPPTVMKEMMNNMHASMQHGMHGSLKMNHKMNHKMNSSMLSMHSMHSMGSMHESSKMDHQMNMPSESTILGDAILPPCPALLKIKTTGTKYQNIKAVYESNDPNKPIDGIIRMELFGYMGSYIWFINGLPEYRVEPIIIEPGKRYRIIFTNQSMMHHPMHIHGHWFILRNGHGVYDPLLHTIDVAPGATAVADVDADASGQWFFHCHHIYHMMGGMARVFQYNTLLEVEKGILCPESELSLTPYKNRPILRKDEVLPIDPCLVEHPRGHEERIYFSNLFDLGADPFHHVQEFTFKGMYGSDYHKLELLMKEAEIDRGKVDAADMDIFYWHRISQFWAIKGGVNYFNQPSYKPYWQPGIGLEGLMPYFIDTDIRSYYYAGSAKFDIDLSRDTQITNRFLIQVGVRSILATKTILRAQIGSGMNQMRYTFRPFYRLKPGLSVFIEYEYTQNYGKFRQFQLKQGNAAKQNTVKFGITINI